MIYKEIQKCSKTEIGTVVQTCWIADVKRELGLLSRVAFNRKNKDYVLKPCPEGNIKNWIIQKLTNET